MTGADGPAWPRSSATPALRIGISRELAHAPVARAAAGSFGATAGLHVDAVEDLRLAVHEAAVLLADLANSEVVVEFRRSASGVDVTATAAGAPGTEIDDTDFGWLILAEITDDLTWTATAGELVVAFTVGGDGAAR